MNAPIRKLPMARPCDTVSGSARELVFVCLRVNSFPLPLVLAILAPAPSYAQLSGDPELLRLVAVENRANRESILTWRCEAHFVTRHVENSPRLKADLTQHCHGEFMYDRRTNRFMFVRTRTLEKGLRDGKPVDDSRPLTWGTIVTEDEVFVALPYHGRDKDEPLKPFLKIDEPSKHQRSSITGPDLDPFAYLEVQDFDVYKRLMAFHATATEPWPGSRTVRREGNRIALEMKTNGIGRYVFDLDQGANPTEVLAEGQGIKTHSVREFAKVDGIWVPRSDTSTYQNGQQGRSVEVTVNFTKHVLNKPLPADAFAPERLGIRKGDLVRDARTRVEYRFEGTPGLGLAGLLKTWKPLVVLGCLVLALIVCLIGWRWRRRRLLEQKRVAVA
jgi:hypothetical protein